MRRSYRHQLFRLLLVALAVCAATSVFATQEEMNTLPSSARFGCAICHVPDGPSALNPFGRDWRDHSAELEGTGPVWDAFLASLDSDGDGCVNGVELGDADGNGFLDGSAQEESSNPGRPGDCQATNPIDESTWGALKALFKTR